MLVSKLNFSWVMGERILTLSYFIMKEKEEIITGEIEKDSMNSSENWS